MYVYMYIYTYIVPVPGTGAEGAERESHNCITK
jgi:hypothetical protein